LRKKISNYLQECDWVESYSIQWRIHEFDDKHIPLKIKNDKSQIIMREIWEDEKTKYWSDYQVSWVRIEINISESHLVMSKLLEEEFDWDPIYRITPYDYDVIISINGEILGEEYG